MWKNKSLWYKRETNFWRKTSQRKYPGLFHKHVKNDGSLCNSRKVYPTGFELRWFLVKEPFIRIETYSTLPQLNIPLYFLVFFAFSL